MSTLPNKNNLSLVRGVVFVAISGVAAGLGNSLEPVSILVWVHIYFLVRGFQMLLNCWLLENRSWFRFSIIIFYTVIIQAAGFCLGFSGIFGYPESTPATIGLSFAFGGLAWVAYSIFGLLPHCAFYAKFPTSEWLPIIFPVCFTMVTHSAIGLTMSNFPCIGNAVIDYEPLKQLSSLIGISGVTFAVTILSTSAGLLHSGHPGAEKVLRFSLFGFLAAMIVTNFIIYTDNFYQKNVSFQIVPYLNVSCVFAQNARVNTSDIYSSSVWSNTHARLQAGDAIVLWAEEALQITSDFEEEFVLKSAQTLAAQFNSGFIGVTYFKLLAGQTVGTNQFALIAPDGKIAWNYLKAHPVPLIESNVNPGPEVLPLYDSPFGRLGGAICFDMDFPQYIRQAGVKKVDIFLQPSWTWNALSSRHFNGDAVRAIENGFTLFRCSSAGESGVVSPRGTVHQRRFTGSDPNVVVPFSLPLMPRVATLYTAVGFTFEWIMLSLSILIYIVLLTPVALLQPVFRAIDDSAKNCLVLLSRTADPFCAFFGAGDAWEAEQGSVGSAPSDSDEAGQLCNSEDIVYSGVSGGGYGGVAVIDAAAEAVKSGSSTLMPLV